MAAASAVVRPPGNGRGRTLGGQLASAVLEDTLRFAAFGLGIMLAQRASIGAWMIQDKVIMVTGGLVGSVCFHVLINPLAERTIRPVVNNL